MKKIIIFLLLPVIVFSQIRQHIPSDQRGDPNLRAYSNIDGNNIRASVFNSGYSGAPREVPESVNYEWPKNTGRIYISIVGIWVGGEVVDVNNDTINIVDVFAWRTSPDGRTWTFEPVPGFLNPNLDPLRVAKSDDPETWPPASIGGWRDKWDDKVDPGWIGSWNGYFGKNVFNADQELFYRCSDDRYDRYQYYPDTTDLTRKGLGILVDVRALAWTQVLINDVVFFIHDIKNDGTKRIPKTSFLIFLADYVGGDGTDDQPFVDIQSDIAFLTDADRVGTDAFGGDPVGVAGIRFLETPGNEVDGIDNDGDSDQYPELLSMINGDPEVILPHFTDDDFLPRNLKPGDKIVLIDSTDFSRIITTYPEGGGTVKSLGKVYYLPAEGTTLEEDTVANCLDDDLDGLIDEKYSLHRWRYDEISGTESPVRYINYLQFNVGDTVKRGFVVAGKNTPATYETVAPMIDESRDDGFDNDRDWDVSNDDVGLDGVKGTGDPGEGDGTPSSGAGTELPGEPNIDKTDVSETDLIGLTSAVQIPVGDISLNTTPDRYLWDYFMVPGHFDLPRPTGEYDTFISSGFFPMDPGQRQRIAIAIAIAGGGQTKDEDIDAVIDKLVNAKKAYEADYQFAKAPIQVTLKAVPGDGKVMLYWDDAAEYSIDNYIESIGGPGRDFEGYRIYRATDPSFLDARKITDGFGTPKLLKPIAQFDLKDGITGFDPVGFNGIHFYLGDDTGLRHSYVDSGVVNGQKYFYAVTAYDFGYAPLNITPTETPVSVDIDLQGNIRTGINVAVVTPTPKAAGYIPPEIDYFEHVRGSATGIINIDIVDNSALKEGHTYELTFTDTTIVEKKETRTVTKSFSVTDISEDEKRIDNWVLYGNDSDIPIFDGLKLSFINESNIEIDPEKSGWNNDDIYDYDFAPLNFPGVKGVKMPHDYRIIIGEPGISTSKDTTIVGIPLPAVDVNFKIINITTGEDIEFAFAELDGSDGRLSVNPRDPDETDIILFLEKSISGDLVYTWQFFLVPKANKRNPRPGDTLNIYLKKPFLSYDVYRFSVKGPSLSKELAKRTLDSIRVVPNPYVATVPWEPKNTYRSGRGPREIHFIKLPPVCTIRIYSVDGTLIDVIEHNSTVDNGMEIWDLTSMENLDISYGLYIYHIDAPGIGQKVGKFAIIK